MIGNVEANGSSTLISVQGSERQQHPARAEHAAQIYREWADEHQCGIERRIQP
jgi:hypothetical protein